MAGAHNTLTEWTRATRDRLRSTQDPCASLVSQSAECSASEVGPGCLSTTTRYDLTQELRAYSACTRRILAARARAVNSTNVFVNLPDAVLRRILSHLSTYHVSPIRFSHICHQLREYTLNSAEVWSKLIPPWLSGNVDFLNMMVERSQGAPLQLFLELTPSSPNLAMNIRAQRVCQLVAENLRRTNTVRLYFNPRMNLPILGPAILQALPFIGHTPTYLMASSAAQWGNEHWRLFMDSVRQPAPMLERLSMSVMAFGMEPFRLPADIFAGQAPCLRSVTLTGVCLTREAYDAFAQLKTLKYTPEPSRVEADELSHLLSGLPQLETLYLHVRTFEWLTPDSSTVPANSRVKRVRLDGMRNGSHHLRPYFTALPNLRELAFGRSFDFHDPVSDTWQVYPIISTVSVSYRAGEIVARRRDAPDSPDSDVRFLFVPEMLDVRAMLQQRAFYAHLTTLTVHEFFWPEDGTLPDAPLLQTLRLILGSCLDYSYDYFTIFQPNQGVASVFSLPPAVPPWRVPALRAVRFTYTLPHKCYRYLDMPYKCCCREVLAVSFADVADFVSRSLSYDSERLAEICFAGMEPMDPDLTGGLARLHSLADVVHLTPEDRSGQSTPDAQIWEKGENYSLFDRALWA